MHKIFEGFLPLRLRVQKLFFLLQKIDVTAMDAKRAIGINPIELDHVGGDILQKITVVADDDAGKGGLFKQVFEPGNPWKIEMVGRFVQKKNVGMLNQSFNNRQPLLPSTG